MSDASTTGPEPDDARLGGTEDDAVDKRAERLRSQGIMPDVAAMREDDREGRD